MKTLTRQSAPSFFLPAFVVLVCIFGAIGIFGELYPFMLIIVAFSFDDPAAAHNGFVYTYVAILLSYPLGPLLSFKIKKSFRKEPAAADFLEAFDL